MIEETGYRRRTYEEILEAKISKAKELFGEDISTEDNTALGKYIRINAYDQARVEEIAEQIYYSINPQTAFGASLDRIVWSVGLQRNVATPARYSVKVTGTAGATVEYGFLVGTESEINYYCTEDTVIGTDGTCTITAECVTPGIIGNVSSADINKIVNPTATVSSVLGTAVIDVGADEESDFELLTRYNIVREGRGGGTAAAIISAVMSVPTVKTADLIVNESATETVDGLPPKSIAVYVDGGKSYEQEIGQAIFDKKPIGIGTYGDKTVTVSYGGLHDYNIKFSYAENVNVYINLTITTNTEFPLDGNEKIKSNINTYIGALKMGKPLITTALYGEVYKVTGVETADIKLSTDGSTYNTNNITVEQNERIVLNQLSINNAVV